MNKLQFLLGSSDDIILKQRAVIDAEAGEAAQTEIVQSLETEIRSLKSKLLNTLDIRRVNKDSLRPSEGVDMKQVFSSIQSLKVSLEIKTRELDIAKVTYKEMFEEDYKEEA